MESEPQSKKQEEDEDADDSDDNDYDGGDEEEKGETKEANQSMWKTRLLPEEGTAQNKVFV